MNYTIIFEIIGVLGLIAIIAGVLLKTKKKEDLAFIVGGILLAVYSIHLKDVIFIILQVVFTFVAIYDYFRKRKQKNI